MRPRTILLLAIGVVAAVVLGALAFTLLQQFLARTLLPGEQALELLQASPYPNLVLEVDHTPGDRPTAVALTVLEARLATYTAKESIEMVFQVIEVNATEFTTLNLLEVERTHRDRATGGDTFALYILSISGELADDSGTALGAAYTANSLAIFKDVIRAATIRPGPSVAEVESSVLVHEIGHIMGLVNLVYTSDLEYEDAEHPFHSDNNTDVMFWAIESAPFAQPPSDFGFETQFDLQKLRDGEYTLIPSRLRELASALDLFAGPHDRARVASVNLRWVIP